MSHLEVDEGDGGLADWWPFILPIVVIAVAFIIKAVIAWWRS